ncbi:sarcinarray family MAST domain-containing protein [Methanolobus profundi]|uniref:Sarcinarray family protein n=1 Tax=Methanolobus profundi TaxID=487685 RepID=A0A1I4NMY8_9EURY|nr:sarcinarray family MAST domain-containing protein [Methanolobus profundi]SFM16902.1 sarcinarray family protein [Methanolobus profundi]
MNIKMLIVVFLVSFMVMPSTTLAESPHISIDVYYNDKFIPITETPKPLLKIGEPFTLRFDVTCLSPGVLSVKLTELADGSFEVVEGPTSKIDKYTDNKLEKNETISYEWTLKPTDVWAGGNMPLDFVYQLNDFDTMKVLVQGEFTAAYVTISEEYYDGPAIPEESIDGFSGDSSSPTTPAFTVLCAFFALVVVSVYRRKQR